MPDASPKWCPCLAPYARPPVTRQGSLWVIEASVEDVKLLPGVHRTMFRLHGGEWVAREIVKDVQRGRAKFILNTGDMVWWGKQGPTPL